MAERQEVAKQGSKETQEAKGSERVIRPPVDIFEDATGITLQADMPGVPKDRLNVRMDRDTLSIGGDVNITMQEGMDALYADVRATRYQRSFSLSRELNMDKVEASLKDGVVTLRIPKREELQPRKIEVRTE